MNKKVVIIIMIMCLMAVGLLGVDKYFNTGDSTEIKTDSTIQSEQGEEEENTEAASTEVSSTDTESQIYDTEEITTLDDGFLSIEPDCDYHFDWDTSTIEENEDGSFTGMFDFAYVRIPVVITEEVYAGIEVGSELPRINHLSYEWGDFKCVEIEDGKKYFVDSTYDSVDEAKKDDFLVVCFDQSCKDSKGNIFVCTDDSEDADEYTREYDYHEFNEQVKVKIAADAKIKYMKSVNDNDITYDTVDFKTFLSDDIMSDYGDFAEREWGMSTRPWHGTGELHVTGNDEGEIVFIEEYWPAG